MQWLPAKYIIRRPSTCIHDGDKQPIKGITGFHDEELVNRALVKCKWYYCKSATLKPTQRYAWIVMRIRYLKGLIIKNYCIAIIVESKSDHILIERLWWRIGTGVDWHWNTRRLPTVARGSFLIFSWKEIEKQQQNMNLEIRVSGLGM